MNNKVLLFFFLSFFVQLSLYAQTDSTTTEGTESTTSDVDNHIHDALKHFKERPEVPKEKTYTYESVKYHIYVIDKETQQPVKATIDIKSVNKDGSELKGKGVCTSTGEFILSLATNSELTMYITYGNYIPKMHAVDLHNLNEVFEIKEITHTVELSKLEVGEYIEMDHISFEQGKFDLLEESYRELDQLVFLMLNNQDMEIEIAGHTDNTGSKTSSVKLSEQRVQAVKDYLVSKGVSGKRIKGVGYGGERPLVDNNSEEARSINRRVEFKVTKM